MFRVAILGSGRGSNAEAVLKAQQQGQLGLAQVIGIFCDKQHASILELGPRFDVPAFYLDPGPYKTKMSPEAEAHWVDTIERLSPDLIVLAGFMRVIKETFLNAFEGRIINLHPSLLPKYPGLRSIQRAWEAGETETGCTVHWVTAEIDGGEIIGQARVPIYLGEPLEEVEKRVHKAEHQLLPSLIAEIAEENLLH